ncbi:uncharacterized protein MYCFIDRAFT_211350 [Pseudocercospora fijiensis CIRAD86]|uniref:Uncharacterized protein n=1 Tax=Pseudocercospora fijiensis (strain CIRAD86) TaxID=383855 RepID=M3B272_PSEFD|nr:uncharacterized protein MYCFIDRAFT_211350 [Pseudocercospora fijiensis CIRAD86]EME83468.1 hypothetical protein MYCFIDRAFT_211350 [Pseudocercospora fijiensis CIRAD86]
MSALLLLSIAFEMAPASALSRSRSSNLSSIFPKRVMMRLRPSAITTTTTFGPHKKCRTCVVCRSCKRITLVPAEGRRPAEVAKWSEDSNKLEDFINSFLRQRGTSGIDSRRELCTLDRLSFPVHLWEELVEFIASTPGGCAGCGRIICGDKKATHHD